MGIFLIFLGVLAMLCAHTKKYGWERDVVLGGLIAIFAGILLTVSEVP